MLLKIFVLCCCFLLLVVGKRHLPVVFPVIWWCTITKIYIKLTFYPFPIIKKC